MSDVAQAADRRGSLLGYAAALGSATGYGMGTFLIALVVRGDVQPMTGSFFSILFGLLALGALFGRGAVSELRFASRYSWLVMSLSGVASAVGVSALYLALERAPVTVASPIAGANPLVAILLAIVFLRRRERVGFRTAAGAALVVVGVALVALGRE